MKIGILASGKLGHTVVRSLVNKVDIAFLATDSKSHDLVRLAEFEGIPVFKGNPREGRLTEWLRNQSIKCDLTLSLNYLFLIEQDTIDCLNTVINFHGSLLPKYRGRTPHVWAIINGETKTGITAHFIDRNCDTGDIVLQKEIRIEPEDTGAYILEKFENIYPEMVEEVIKGFQNDALTVVVQNQIKATFFGKRTPEDGGICWDWEWQRIKNWVRAQAYPYPGAFTFCEEQKLVIDRVSYSDHGFNQNDPNGLVLSVDPVPIVKCPNGALALDVIRNGAKPLLNKILK